jgi:8-oxo-dGTP pyrophosphatase MutT (NUDIX family)
MAGTRPAMTSSAGRDDAVALARAVSLCLIEPKARENTSMAAVTPRPASTILLLRDAAPGMEVFMVVRHHQIDFATGALVFPGGSVDPDDGVVAAQPRRVVASDGVDPYAMTLRVGGIRETFEECGVLIARPRGDKALVSAKRLIDIEAKHRARLHAKDTKFSDILAAEDLVTATDLLVPFAHWITPPHMPKRFDTHFFLAVAPPDQLAAHDGHESVDSIWISPGEALQGADSGRFTVIFPTRLNVEKLGRSRTTADAVAAARADKIVTVMPGRTNVPDGVIMHIPAEAGYGGPDFHVKRPS